MQTWIPGDRSRTKIPKPERNSTTRHFCRDSSLVVAVVAFVAEHKLDSVEKPLVNGQLCA